MHKAVVEEVEVEVEEVGVRKHKVLKVHKVLVEEVRVMGRKVQKVHNWGVVLVVVGMVLVVVHHMAYIMVVALLLPVFEDLK